MHVPPTQADAVPAAQSPVPEPPATAPEPPAVQEQPVPAPVPPAATTPAAGQTIASWPVRVPLANGSWVWMTVPYPMPARATETPDAAPTTQPVGHDATLPPAGA
jgi:hypothetical protein